MALPIALGYDNGALSGQAYGPVPRRTGFSGGGSQVHSASAPAPAHSLPGSLSFAGGLILLFVACGTYVYLAQYTRVRRWVSRRYLAGMGP